MSESKCASCVMGTNRIEADESSSVSGFCSESCDCSCHDKADGPEREVWHKHKADEGESNG